jgi:hypothetical protein
MRKLILKALNVISSGTMWSEFTMGPVMDVLRFSDSVRPAIRSESRRIRHFRANIALRTQLRVYHFYPYYIYSVFLIFKRLIYFLCSLILLFLIPLSNIKPLVLPVYTSLSASRL